MKSCGRMWICLGLLGLLVRGVSGQQAPIVQPGAPGTPSHVLPAATAPVGQTVSAADLAFMQGMVMHHGQAVEMTELLKTRAQDPAVRELGLKIGLSQTDEMGFMRRWLKAHGAPAGMGGMDHGSMSAAEMGQMEMSMPAAMPLMPGMLTAQQMETLRKSRGAEFDRLFLSGMIQHHGGALVMVRELFDSPGAGQDADLFDFATDVDNTQRAEIEIMQGLLKREADGHTKD